MPIQIANPTVVQKVERLAKVMGLTKTAAVELAVDKLLRATEVSRAPTDQLDALLAQLDRVPDLRPFLDPLEWDALGLPK